MISLTANDSLVGSVGIPLVIGMRVFGSVAVVFAGLVALSPVAKAADWAEARKVCAERFEDEARNGTVPERMTKARYLSLCQNSFVRSSQMGDEFEEGSDSEQVDDLNAGLDGQGGPEIPVQAEPRKPAKLAAPKPAVAAKP